MKFSIITPIKKFMILKTFALLDYRKPIRTIEYLERSHQPGHRVLDRLASRVKSS